MAKSLSTLGTEVLSAIDTAQQETTSGMAIASETLERRIDGLERRLCGQYEEINSLLSISVGYPSVYRKTCLLIPFLV